MINNRKLDERQKTIQNSNSDVTLLNCYTHIYFSIQHLKKQKSELSRRVKNTIDDLMKGKELIFKFSFKF